MTFVTRFAPSPTGPLHLGHAYSALLAHDMAMDRGGDFLLRIEDIDQSRARPEWELQIYQDLKWLGLHWSKPVLRQSDQLDRYKVALNHLWARDLIYPCTCSRRDIQMAASAPQEGGAPLTGPDGVVYPGTCRANQTSFSPDPLPIEALRLNMRTALGEITNTALSPLLRFQEGSKTVQISASDCIENIGDVVLARRDMGTSYHLSVVLDDAQQNVTDVVRGSDLFEATKIHVVLQRLLGLPTPTYHHHKLIRDEHEKRLAKRDDARAIATYRAEGATPQDIRAMVGL